MTESPKSARCAGGNFKWLWAWLAQPQDMELPRDERLMQLGSAKSKVPAAWRLVGVKVEEGGASCTYHLNRKKLKIVLRREGRYLLRTNLTDTAPVKLWNYYLQLVQVEEAFRTLKSDLAIRPIFHQRMENIEAHVFTSLPRVLPVRHARAATEEPRSGPHQSQRALEICRRADGRCAHPHHRRARTFCLLATPNRNLS
jgi:hypothetical protein